MTSLFRVRTALTGFPGGPGVSTMYFLGTNTALDSVRAFWLGLAPLLPVTLTAQVENTGDEIESTTGALVGSFAKAAVAPVTGTSLSSFAGPTGAVVTWTTNTIASNRRLRGRTFIVPLSSAFYQVDGTLIPDGILALKNTADSLIFEQSLTMVVWHRPVVAKAATPTSLAVAARAGSHGLVTGSRVPDKAAVLRSRRD